MSGNASFIWGAIAIGSISLLLMLLFVWLVMKMGGR